MKVIHISIFLLGFLLGSMVTNHAYANNTSPYKPGLNHTVVNKHTKAMAIKKKNADQASETPIDHTEKTEDTKSRIWNKYKALAAGQEIPAPNQATTQNTPAKSKIEQVSKKAPTKAQSSVGMASIIEQYSANKQKRSQMRSLKIDSSSYDTKQSK